MVSTFHGYLILVLLPTQLCNNVEKYCKEAVESVTIVNNCPTSKEEWNRASKKKNCRVMAEMQNCTDTDSFVYHCVIGGFRKGTLELCAPKTIIYGSCPEFDVIKGIIRGQESVKCNDFFPKCGKIYNSTDAYKYSDCYKLVSISGVPNIPLKETTADKTIVFIVCFAVLSCVTCVLVSRWINMWRTKKLRQHHHSRRKKEAIYMPKQAGVDVGVVVNEHELLPLITVESENKNVSQTTNDTAVFSTKRVEGIIEKNETRPFIVRMNEADTASTTDRHAFAMSTSKERRCEENKDGSSRYLKCYEAMDRYFVETNTYKEAEQTFTNHGIIIMTGPSGCGKTVAAIHLIFKQKDWTFRKINSWEDLSLVDKDKRTVLLIDNIFSDTARELHLEHWWKELECIYDQCFASKDTKLKAECTQIIITARKNVIKRACNYMGRVTPILHEMFFKDLSELSEKEKKEIFLMQSKFATQERMIDMNTIGENFSWGKGESDGPIGFPLCAHLYVFHKKYRESGSNFLSKPIEYLKLHIKDEIERDKSNRKKSLFFVLFFREWYIKNLGIEIFEIKNESHCKRFLDKISPNLRQHFSPFDFRDLEREAEILADAFFMAVGEHTHTFFHDSVSEAAGAYFCETYVTETAKYFPLDIIKNQKYDKLTEKQQLTLITRLFYEIIDGRLDQVFACRIFQNVNFVNCFCAELKKKDTEFVETFFTVSNKSPKAIMPSMFWSSCNNLAYLTELLLYEISSHYSLDTDYQLYVSLYGMCCAKNISELQKINGKPQIKKTDLKDLVFNFLDHENNCILHLLVTSDSSDEFVANAIEKLAKDGIEIHKKNFKRTTPLMFAVEQAVPRTKVIETISKYSPILRYKDCVGSTVFHYCLGSSNDDEMCAKYLKILLKGKDAAKCVSKDDMFGNTALHIAAVETKRSRLMSIVELLESNVDNVHVLYEDGCSPLHLTIRSVKKGSKFYQIECCIRVIIIILYSADSNRLLDTSDTAIDECEYEWVKSILRNPDDSENMKKELDILLEGLNWKEDSAVPETSFISSRYFDTGLQTSINNAVHHLKNVAF